MGCICAQLVLEAAKRHQQVVKQNTVNPIVWIEVAIVLIPESARLRRIEQFTQRQGIIEKGERLDQARVFASALVVLQRALHQRIGSQFVAANNEQQTHQTLVP